MGWGKRSFLSAAVTVVCAVTVLGAPGTAFADPSPTPSASPTPLPGKDLEKVREKLDKLYHDAAVATDAYNAAEERTQQQSARIVALAKKIVEGQDKLDRLKDQAGAAARAQYRTGGIPPTAAFLLSDDPGQVLDGAGLVLQGQRATKTLMTELTSAQEQLQAYADAAADQWTKLDTERQAEAAAKKKIQQQIAAAEKLESNLEKKDRERLAELENAAALKAQTDWLDTGILKEIHAEASAQGEKAVAFATAQLGKPYVWGAQGPRSFDCSGLTSQAWSAAGHPIPRTSQEQWKELKHVGIKDMRPGDLIIYFDDASHVAIYVGDGAIIQAPRPGRTVTIAGAGSMPILGVVRPDA